ncbi:hypothetical protein B0H12DRAFT_235127 [Mycena haematopus]|nr:hypothetical protein B0H12DRAFT_235127 [Mycena haematopus]
MRVPRGQRSRWQRSRCQRQSARRHTHTRRSCYRRRLRISSIAFLDAASRLLPRAAAAFRSPSFQYRRAVAGTVAFFVFLTFPAGTTRSASRERVGVGPETKREESATSHSQIFVVLAIVTSLPEF